MNGLQSIYSVFLKEIKSEFRRRYAISSILLFILTTITMILFSTAGESIDQGIAAGIFWIIIFFSNMTGLAGSFISEEERSTGFFLSLISEPYAIYLGKLIYNCILSVAMNITAAALFFLFIDKVVVNLPFIFLITIITGSIAIACATTIISAVIAKANSKNSIFPILSFPVLLPIIILGIELTKHSFSPIAYEVSYKNFGMIIAYSGIMVTLSYYLFEIVWKD